MSLRFRLGYLGAAAVAIALMLIGLDFAIDPVSGATSAGFGFSAVSLGEAKGVRDIAQHWSCWHWCGPASAGRREPHYWPLPSFPPAMQPSCC